MSVMELWDVCMNRPPSLWMLVHCAALLVLVLVLLLVLPLLVLPLLVLLLLVLLLLVLQLQTLAKYTTTHTQLRLAVLQYLGKCCDNLVRMQYHLTV